MSVHSWTQRDDRGGLTANIGTALIVGLALEFRAGAPQAGNKIVKPDNIILALASSIILALAVTAVLGFGLPWLALRGQPGRAAVGRGLQASDLMLAAIVLLALVGRAAGIK
jgi:hypothetical protein